MKLAVIALVIIILIALLFFLRPRNTAFHRNVRPRTVKILMFILLIALICAVIWFAITAKKEGVGNLNSDRGVTNETPGVSEDEGEILEITISSDHIRIGKKKYESVQQTRAVLETAAKERKQFLLTDDYASKDLYLGIKKLLSELGVDPADIEEVTAP